VDINPVNNADAHKISQSVKCRANERSPAIPVIDKLSFERHRCAVTVSALTERSHLTFDCMRGRLLFAGDTRVKRSSNRGHRTLRAKALTRLGRVQARRLLEQNLT
jgi:hypothetical protein